MAIRTYIVIRTYADLTTYVSSCETWADAVALSKSLLEKERAKGEGIAKIYDDNIGKGNWSVAVRDTTVMKVTVEEMNVN